MNYFAPEMVKCIPRLICAVFVGNVNIYTTYSRVGKYLYRVYGTQDD